MSISSQLPPIPLAVASASLRALAQAAGQTVEARVLSQAGNGATQVQIGRQVLTLNLPQSQPVGATLTLSVQQTDGHLQLTLEGVRPPASGTPPTSGPAQNAPATQVQLSAIALSGGQLDLAPATRATLQGAVSPAASNRSAAPSTYVSAQVSSPITAPAPAYGGGAALQSGPGAISSGAPASGQVGSSAAVPSLMTVPAAGVPATPQAVNVTTASVPAASVGSSAQTPSVMGGTSPQTAPASAQVSGQSGIPPAPTTAAPAMSAPVVATSTGAVGPATGTIPRADIPYAVAAPATAPGASVVGVAGSASTALPPVGQAVSSSIVGQHAPPPNMTVATATQSGQTHPQVVLAQAPATSQAALVQMVQQALPRQDSVVGLTTALSAAMGKFALPEPVAKAAQQVLGIRVVLDGPQPSGAVLKNAVLKSGIFQEALLASGQGTQAASDTKSALLGLRQSLGTWLGQQAPVAQVSGVAPPLRGLLPRARAGDGGMPALPEDALEAGRLLLERTEAALSRVRLHQNASLPEQSAARQDAQWSLDLPVVVAGQQHLLHMQIHKDPEGADERPEDRGWQVRFAINLSDAGEIGAQISLRAGSAGVLLWAERADTAAALSADVEALKSELSMLGLKPGAVVIRRGPPTTPARTAPTASGRHLDATL